MKRAHIDLEQIRQHKTANTPDALFRPPTTPNHYPARFTIHGDVARHQTTTAGQLIAMLNHYDADAPVMVRDAYSRFVPAMVVPWDEERKGTCNE